MGSIKLHPSYTPCTYVCLGSNLFQATVLNLLCHPAEETLCYAEMLITLEPLPFANAEGPLKLLPQQQAAGTVPSGHQEANDRGTQMSHSPGQHTAPSGVLLACVCTPCMRVNCTY